MKIKLVVYSRTLRKMEEFFDADAYKVTEAANGSLRVDWTHSGGPGAPVKLVKVFARGEWTSYETVPE